MEHHLAIATAGDHAALGVAQLSGGQRTLLSLALILAVSCLAGCPPLHTSSVVRCNSADLYPGHTMSLLNMHMLPHSQK